MNQTRGTVLVVVGGMVAVGALLNALWVYLQNVQPEPCPTLNWVHFGW